MSVGPWNTEEQNFEDQFEDNNEDAKHPTLQQLCMIEAVKTFTEKQRVIWDYLTLDRLTQVEVGEKLGISQQGVADHMEACGNKISKWAKHNKAAYERLRKEIQSQDGPDRPNGWQAMRDSSHKTPVRRIERDGEWHD